MSAPIKLTRIHWSDAQIEALCSVMKTGLTQDAAARQLGLTKGQVAGQISRMRTNGDPRLPRENIQRGPAKLPMPADFAARAPHLFNTDLRTRYGVCLSTILRWRRECGIRRTDPRANQASFKPTPMPENFAALAPTMLMHEARAFFGVGDGPLRRWAMDAGIAFRRTATGLQRATTFKVDRVDNRDMSRAGLAAEFLRRFGPVYRCDENGRPEGKPTHWRRGSFVLTDEEIIQRAERNGWKPDAWCALLPTNPERLAA